MLREILRILKVDITNAKSCVAMEPLQHTCY